MKRAMAAIVAAMVAGVVPAAAQEAAAPASKGLIFQLNNAQTDKGNCQLFFVIENNTAAAVESSSYDIAIVDAEGRISSVTKFGFHAFPIGVTKVERFVLGEQTCDRISGLLINDVKECLAADGAPLTVCRDQMEQSSNTTIAFPWRLKR